MEIKCPECGFVNDEEICLNCGKKLTYPVEEPLFVNERDIKQGKRNTSVPLLTIIIIIIVIIFSLKMINKKHDIIVPVATNSPSVKDPVKLLEDNYRFIRDKDFKKAYSLRSLQCQRKISYEEFYNTWKTNVTIRLESSEIIYQSTKEAKIKVRLYSEDKDPSGGKIFKAYYSGSVSLVNEKGNWRLNSSDIMKE